MYTLATVFSAAFVLCFAALMIATHKRKRRACQLCGTRLRRSERTNHCSLEHYRTDLRITMRRIKPETNEEIPTRTYFDPFYFYNQAELDSSYQEQN